ncbi:MAG: glutamate formimidoyltransferase [Acidimicrobiales bacterium]
MVNFSEGRDAAVVTAVARAGGDHVLDVHSDPHHHRSVLTIAGPDTEDATRAVSRRAVELIDIRRHAGVHPRFGAVDVVPFVALDARGTPDESDAALARALSARERFASWAADELAVPCFCYGPERSLPETRRRAFVELAPDFGPREPHPSAGSCAVGARGALVAYNVWLSTSDEQVAAHIAREVRSPQVRALGLRVGDYAQVSCNLLEPLKFGPEQAYDLVADLAGRSGVGVARAELVGLAPSAVVEAVPPDRRRRLDVGDERTIEGRLQARRSSPG